MSACIGTLSSYFWGCNFFPIFRDQLSTRHGNHIMLLWKVTIHNSYFAHYECAHCEYLCLCISTFRNISRSEILKLAVDLSQGAVWAEHSSSLRNTVREVTAQVFMFHLEMESFFFRRAYRAFCEPETCILYVCYEHYHNLTFNFLINLISSSKAVQ